MKQSCRTCKHFDLEGVKSPSGRVQSGRVARCLYVIPGVVLPSSVDARARRDLNLSKRYMQAADGTDCLCWSPRKDIPASEKPE
jgi:hypothetical protein